MEEIIIKIKNKADEFLGLLEFDGEAIVTIRGNVYYVGYNVLESPAGLIGRGGEAVDCLQHLLRAALNKELLDETPIIVVDVNGYKDKRSNNIEKLAREIAHRVRTNGLSEEMEPMNSYERRIVHSIITNIADVESGSVGERESRRVIIKPKK